MRLSWWVFLALCAALVGCGAFEADPNAQVDGVGRCYANASLPAGRHPERFALDGGYMYVMDGYSGVTRFERKSYGCDWELDRGWQSGGSLQFNGFLQDLDLDAGGNLAAKDGGYLYFPGQDTCGVDQGNFAVFPEGNGFAISSSLGTQTWSKSAGACRELGGSLGIGEALGVDADDYGIVTVETVAGPTPERLVSYGLDGSHDWVRPLSIHRETEPYLCGVDRVRVSAQEIVLWDRSCGRLVSFGRDGVWIATVLLDSLGIRSSRVRDMAISGLGTAELLVDASELTIQVSWRSMLGNATKGIIDDYPE